MNPIDIRDFMQRAADRTGFVRERFDDKRIPKDPGEITVMPLFPDLRHACILSQMIFQRYRNESKGTRYFIACGWPGFQGLFQGADEYWSLRDGADLIGLYEQCDGMKNRSEQYTIVLRNLNENFRDVVDVREFEPYYCNGIKPEFWDAYRHVKRYRPMVPSSALLGKDFNRDLAMKAGYKVFLWPSRFLHTWKNGRVRMERTNRDFWLALVRRLLDEKIVPVLWRTPLAYDLSADFLEQCVYLNETDLLRTAGAMRAVGCVLDVFNGVSRLAALARTPFLCCDERQRHMNVKEYEVDDLLGPDVPKQYIFTFSTIINGGVTSEVWNGNLFNNVVGRLNALFPVLDRNEWPATSEATEIVPYEKVRTYNIKKLGVRLLKITRD